MEVAGVNEVFTHLLEHYSDLQRNSVSAGQLMNQGCTL